MTDKQVQGQLPQLSKTGEGTSTKVTANDASVVDIAHRAGLRLAAEVNRLLLEQLAALIGAFVDDFEVRPDEVKCLLE